MKGLHFQDLNRLYTCSRQRTLLFVVLLTLGSLFLFFCSHKVVQAAPVAPIKVTLIQPDGSRFAAVPFGDEWYSGYELNGYTILQNQTDGYWYFARQLSTGQLRPSLFRAGIDQPIGLTPNLRDHSLSGQQPDNALLSGQSVTAWPGVSGSQPVLVILVDFTPSTSLGTTAAQWHDAFFDTSAGAKSVKAFYEQASYGHFTVDPVVETQGSLNDGIIEVEVNYAHPDTDYADTNRQITKDALIAANPYVDYSAYDLNNDLAIDVTELHLIIIPRGFETAFGGSSGACSPSVWGHRSSLYDSVMAPTLDGVKMADRSSGGGYMQFGEWHESTGNGCNGDTGNMATIGIMAHEFGHDINWPDLYDTDSSSSGVGYWSVMASGTWASESDEPYGKTPTLPDPFSKWYQGWLTPTQVTNNISNVAIPNSAQNPEVFQLLNNPNAIDWEFEVSSGTGEYFLLENRQQVGFDAGLHTISPSAAGCLIWHIDETRTSNNSNNNNENHKHVDVEEADGIQDMDSGSNRGDAGDPWPGSTNHTTFGAGSIPNSNLYSGAESGVTVTNISSAGTGCTVDLIVESPVISVSPSSLVATASSGALTTEILTVSNAGGGDLIWTLSEDAAVASFTDAGQTTVPRKHKSPALDKDSRPLSHRFAIRTKAEAEELPSGLSAENPYPGLPSTAPGDTLSPTASLALTDFVEGFDDITVLPGWVTQNNSDVAGTTAWFQGNSSAFPAQDGTADAYIAANFQNTAGSQISNWLMTPELDFADDSQLSFWTRTADGSIWPDRLQIRISSSGASTDVGTTPSSVGDFTDLALDINENLNQGGYPETWTQYTIDLSSYAGQSGRVAFRYFVDVSAGWLNANYIGIDSVIFGGKPPCISPTDIPWLSVNPTNGTTLPDDSTTVDVTFDATAMAPGSYDATLCINSNDLVSSLLPLPVSMVVEACAAPENVSDLSISRDGNALILSWSATGADQYEIHSALNDAYFVPDTNTLVDITSATTYQIDDRPLSLTDTFTYLVIARNSCGAASAVSNRVSEFSFALTPG